MPSFRVEKARGFLAAAELCLEHGLLESAMSRASYAAYHLLVEVLQVERGLDVGRWQHDAVVNAFGNEFCGRGLYFSWRDHESLKRLLEDRLDADYHQVVPHRRRAERSVERSKSLCQALASVLKEDW